jgi:DNA modification methylase
MLYFVKDKIPKDLLEYFEPAECGRCYICKLVKVFHEVKRILVDSGVLFLNLGDTYAGSGCGTNDYRTEASVSLSRPRLYDGPRPQNKIPLGLKPKDLIGIPWRVAFALQADGWYLRQDIIWSKPNPMPESVTDRCTKAHEYIFLFSKNQRYYFDNEAIKEEPSTKNSFRKISPKMIKAGRMSINREGYYTNPNGRNKRSVWTVTTKPFKEAHFATFPPDLIMPCILAGSKPNDIVLDPFIGSGTTALVAQKLNRNFIGIDLSEKYCKTANERLRQEYLDL